MNTNTDSLKNFLDRIKTIGFWQRLFSWNGIKQQLVDAATDLQKLISNADNLKDENLLLSNKNINIEKDLKIVNDSVIRKEGEVNKLSSSLQETSSKVSQLEKDLSSRETIIANVNSRLNEISIEHKVLVESHNNLSKENVRLSAEVAANAETITNNISKVSELSIANSSLTEKNNILSAESKRLSTDIAANTETIINNNARISELLLSNNSFIEKNDTLSVENKRLATAGATTAETIMNNTTRINEIITENKVLTESNSNLLTDNKRLSKENATNSETITNLSKRKSEIEVELGAIKVKLDNIQAELKTVKQQNIALLSDEENKRKKYDNDAATLTSIREQIQNERSREIEDRNAAEIERIKKLKETWGKHQETVKGAIKAMCNKHAIEYMDKVPFRGEPDNTLKICDELVIFDAKSPGSDDLTNFPNYLKDQAERAKKYAKQDNVKTDIFFVVPTNTLEKLANFVFNLGDYNVFIISVDSLEQIILSLKKIEEYEFAEQLSPEERENICRVLGKFAHLTKRRIQIDSFFAKQFIELAYKCESDLPAEIFEKVVEFEKSEKLNPPTEKRAKAISTKELERDTAKLKTEASSKGILIDDLKISTGLNDLQLYIVEPAS